MKIDDPWTGKLLAVICLVILVLACFVPLWTIDRKQSVQSVGYKIYLNSTYDFKLFGVSTVHRQESPVLDEEDWLETSYFDVEDSDLPMHFTAMTIMVLMAAVFIVLILVVNRRPQKKDIYRLVSLGLGFAVIFLSLGSGAYLNIFVPPAVGESRDNLGIALESPYLHDIRTFTGSDLNETGGETIETTWGPSVGWYMFFVVCVIMVFSIWFLESKPKEHEEKEQESED